MPKIRFEPNAGEFEAQPNAKVLAVATRNKVPIRFGCASCRCGTCAVRVSGDAQVTPMSDDERNLLARMLLPTDGTIRLSCQTRILEGNLTVDLSFQNEYSPDQGEGDD